MIRDVICEHPWGLDEASLTGKIMALHVFSAEKRLDIYH